MSSFETLVKRRRSTKRFSEKKPNWKKVVRAIDLARFIPAAGNIQTTKFILVQDKDKIKQAADAAQQPFIKKAPMLIVVTSNRKKVKELYDYNNKGFSEQQAGASIQNLLLALTDQKIASCWVGFFDETLMKQIFSVPASETIEAVIPIGFRTKTISQGNDFKDKPDLENMVYFEEHGEKEMNPDKGIRQEQWGHDS